MWLRSSQKGRSVFVTLPADRRKKHTIHGLSVLAVLIFSIGIYTAFIKTADAQTANPVSHSQALTVTSPSLKSTQLSTNDTANTQSVSKTPEVTTSQSPTATYVLPQCTPDNSYQMPTVLAATAPGLNQVIDDPSTYNIYGDTTAEVNSQMYTCTPVHSTGTGGSAGNYAASTAITLAWNISYNENPDGLCILISANVISHINQVFPNWVATSGSPASLSVQWQNYITKLHSYEAGHKSLDEQEGSSVYNDLVSMPAISCDTINQAAQAIFSQDTAKYNAANSAYDISNQFGLKEDVSL
jgi:predicted secreted Zn-dependent protease